MIDPANGRSVRVATWAVIIALILTASVITGSVVLLIVQGQ